MAEPTDKPVKETARDEAKSVGEELREKGAETAQAARDTAQGYAERVRDEAYARGEAYRDHAAGETSKVASALRRASEDLSSGSPQERFVGQMADGVAEAADRMRGMSLEDIARDTSRFARRHPAAFLGGAAMIGFAAARFLKASARDDDDADELYLPAEARRDDRLASSEPIPAPATQPVKPAPGAATPSTGPGAASVSPSAPSRP